jgi:succinyl-CoA synthetase alpha subunit
MTILLDRATQVLVLGITGKIGSFHTQEMIAYGTNIVGGVTPGKGGSIVHNVPVFDTVKEAVDKTGATAAVVFVPPPFAADSIMEAADAGLKLCVAITDGIPAKDMIRVKRYMRRYARENRMQLIGPNCAGIISPGKSLLGIMPGHIEIGGPQEAEAAAFIREHMTKPVAAYVAGLSAPKGRRMGHAGAIIQAFGESASEKVELLRDAGVAISPSPSEIGRTMETLLKAA